MTQTNPPPSSSDWSWTDYFDRSFVGPDYTVTAGYGSVATDGTSLVLITNLQAQAQNSTLRNAVDLAPARWNSGHISVQYDLALNVASLASNAPWTPYAGVEIVGQTKTLRWDGAALLWGGVQLASAGTEQSSPEGESLRYRLTVDRAAGQIQLSRAGGGLIQAPVPDDYDAGMGSAGTVRLFAEARSRTASNSGLRGYTLLIDNLAVRSGDGTADLSTGTANSSAGVRLGGEWRFGAAPDNSIGADGDIWATPDGGIYQRETGVYALRTTLVGAKGDKGDAGESIKGDPGETGAQGPPGDPVALANPILVDLTGDDGLVIEVRTGEGGLAGVQLLAQSGPPVTLDLSPDGATWATLALPHTLAVGEWLRLTRTDPAAQLSVIHALVPTVQGTSSGFTVGRDEQGYLTTDSPLTRDDDGYLTTDTPLTRDADGYLSDGA